MSNNDDSYYYSDNNNYTDVYMEYMGLSRQTALNVGIGYLSVAAITFILYLRLISIIHFDKNLNQLPAYRIILQNGLADCLMLALWVIAGIISISTAYNATVMKIVGAMYVFGNYSGSSFTLLLAINRFTQIIFYTKVDEIFSPKLTTIYMIVCWLSALPTPILALTSVLTYRYYAYWVSWGYSDDDNIRALFINIDTFVLLAKITAATILILVTIAYMICKRNQVSKVELRLTVQTMFDAFVRLSGYLFWEFFWAAAVNSIALVILHNWLLLLASATNTYIYLAFNKSLRSQFLPEMVRNKMGKKKLTVTSSTKLILVTSKISPTIPAQADDRHI